MVTDGEQDRKMTVDVARSASRRGGQTAGILAAVIAVLLLAFAAQAWATGTTEATATLAPIGTGSYLLTVTNTGTEEIGAFSFGGENLSNFASTPGFPCVDTNGSTICGGSYIAPKAAVQVCYSGPAVGEVKLGLTIPVKVSNVPAVATCPVPGFTPAPSGGGSGGSGGSGGAGSGGSGGGGGSTQPTNPSPSPTAPKCKKGFKKKTVHSKTKCVKVKHKKSKH